MPIQERYACDVCGKNVNDNDLAGDGTLRRFLVNGGAYKAIAGTPTVIQSKQTPLLVFCGPAHVKTWLDGFAF